MIDFLFPVEYHEQFDVRMIQDWQNSGRPYLTFAFNRFFPSTLPREPFWLYFYYTKSSTQDPFFRGRARFRFHVIDWAPNAFRDSSTYFFPSHLEFKIWFKVDLFQEVGASGKRMLAYEDFRHPEGKNLGSCMRSSITPAVCLAEIQVLRQYPAK